MITFHSVTYKNFLSSGDSPVTICLDKSATSLIIGSNGAGKSTLLDALSFGLFGKPHRDIKNPQLINSVNGKNCEVQINFSIGQDKYRIVRGYKPSIFEIWKNSVLLNQESHSRDYQKILENSILKLNKKSFNQIVVLGSGNFVPFMQMPIWDRRGVIEDLLDISIFSDMNTLIKEKLAKSRDNIKDVENQLAIAKGKVTLQIKHLNDLKQIEGEHERSIQNEILAIELDISQKKNQLIKFEEEYNLKFQKVEDELNASSKKQLQLDGFHTQIVQNQKRVQKEHDFYSRNDNCPTCEQIISSDLKTNRLNSTLSKLNEFSEGLKQLAESREKNQNILNDAKNSMAELKKLHMASTGIQASIDSLNGQINNLKQKLQSSTVTDTRQAETELSQSQADLARLSELKSNQVEERAYLDIVQEMLRDTGIKAKVIKQYVPIMNKLINQYLNVLDFFVSFTLDESFNESIRSRHRDDFSYSSFSEGEKGRLNLAILFAWRQIAKLKNHNSTNLLILDEVLDSSLDADGVDNLFKIIKTLTNTNVFIISHRPDMHVGKFDRMIKFTKSNNFSAYTEEDVL